jgi:DNA-binding NtrC family response regulator
MVGNMSGYTDDAIVHHGVLDPGTNFIEKPFTAETLTSTIRDVLKKSARPNERNVISIGPSATNELACNFVRLIYDGQAYLPAISHSFRHVISPL